MLHIMAKAIQNIQCKPNLSSITPGIFYRSVRNMLIAVQTATTIATFATDAAIWTGIRLITGGIAVLVGGSFALRMLGRSLQTRILLSTHHRQPDCIRNFDQNFILFLPQALHVR